jgi:hypothetical protein
VIVGNVGHKAKINKFNIMIEYTNVCYKTNNNNKNTNRGSSPREIIIILRTEFQGGVEECD